MPMTDLNWIGRANKTSKQLEGSDCGRSLLVLKSKVKKTKACLAGTVSDRSLYVVRSG